LLSFIKETAVNFYISIDKVYYEFLLIGRNYNDILLRTRGPYHRQKSTKSG